MDDLISRKAVLKAINNMVKECDSVYVTSALRNLEVIVADVPSAQPDLSEYSDRLWEAAYERGKTEAQQKWIPCSERLPENTVLATIETKTFKHRYVCEAVWIPRWTWRADFDNWEDCSEYNEDEDEFYVLEGWYERVHNWDEYSYVGIEDNVIAWMPLPEPMQKGEPMIAFELSMPNKGSWNGK